MDTYSMVMSVGAGLSFIGLCIATYGMFHYMKLWVKLVGDYDKLIEEYKNSINMSQSLMEEVDVFRIKNKEHITELEVLKSKVDLTLKQIEEVKERCKLS